jgi:RHS repeat-associated protein
VALTTDVNGIVKQGAEYLPYGAPANAQDSKLQPYGFSAKERDASELMYFEARYYDPLSTRFISPDPLFAVEMEKCIESIVECNLYQYTGNNPVNFVDPDGEELIKVNASSTSAFDKSFIVDQSYLPVIVGMNDLAKARGIEINVQQMMRASGKDVKGAIVKPATRSNHLIGRGVDVNFTDKDNTFYNSKMLSTKNMSENIKGFVSEVKMIKSTSQFDKAESPRWGGDFKTKDPVHFDMASSRKTFNALFDENQKQFQSGEGIGSMDLE